MYFKHKLRKKLSTSSREYFNPGSKLHSENRTRARPFPEVGQSEHRAPRISSKIQARAGKSRIRNGWHEGYVPVAAWRHDTKGKKWMKNRNAKGQKPQPSGSKSRDSRRGAKSPAIKTRRNWRERCRRCSSGCESEKGGSSGANPNPAEATVAAAAAMRCKKKKQVLNSAINTLRSTLYGYFEETVPRISSIVR